METKKPLMPCIWCNLNADEKLEFYGAVFKDFKVGERSYYLKDMPVAEGKLLSAIMTINGGDVMLLNATPDKEFNESISLVVTCEDQQEIDYYWEKLTADGGKEIQCSWLQDKFGMLWQIVPRRLMELIADPDREKASRVLHAMMQMVKIDLAKIEDAAAS